MLLASALNFLPSLLSLTSSSLICRNHTTSQFSELRSSLPEELSVSHFTPPNLQGTEGGRKMSFSLSGEQVVPRNSRSQESALHRTEAGLLQNELQDLAISPKVSRELLSLSIHLPRSQNTKASVLRAKLLNEPRRLDTDAFFFLLQTC